MSHVLQCTQFDAFICRRRPPCPLSTISYTFAGTVPESITLYAFPLTIPVARELSQFGIRVMAIAPGIFGTPMLKALPQAAQDSLGASVPFPKRLGEPHEFAELVMTIVRSGYLNGEVIRIDGALRMAPR